MNIGEFGPELDVLHAYRAIDVDVPIGGLPFAAYREMIESGNSAELTPGVRYDAAWLQLEASIAMMRDNNPATGASFSGAEISTAQQQVRAEFRAVMADQQTTPSLRAKAALALASVGPHYDMAGRRIMSDRARLAYLSGIQTAAKQFLPERRGSETEDFDILNTMLSLAVITEFTAKSAWPLPTPPRHPWHINVHNRKVVGGCTRILIADEAPEGIVPIQLPALGDDLWEIPGWYASLMQYVKLKPGFISAKEEKLVESFFLFREIWKRHRFYLDTYHATHPDSMVVVGQVAVTSEVATSPEEVTLPSAPTEVSWYLVQSAHDVRDLDQRHLRLHAANLKMAETNLAPAYRHTLGWMQLDYGRTLTLESRRKQTEADALHVQASRVSKYDAPAITARAKTKEAEAAQLMEAATASFSEACTTLAAAAAAMTPERPGEAFEMLLDSEAAKVYKALFTYAEAEEIAAVNDNYRRQLAALYIRLKQAEPKLRQDPDQLDSLHAAALRATLCLLIADSSEETARHFAVTASPRAGGSRGEVDAMIIPIDHVNSTYDPAVAVNVRIAPGAEVVVGPHHIEVGLGLLTTKGNMLGLLAKLAAVVRSTKPGARKQSTRGGEIDALALRLADAIVDASE